MKLTINGAAHDVDVEADTPLLWVLRDTLGLTGTKFGCGIGQCGSCTVQLNGMPVRSCQLPVAGAVGVEIRTIEGLDHAVQQAWMDEQVPQCGYCQSGQLMAAAALLDVDPRPDDATIDAWMTNLCRCATYGRIRKAIRRAAETLPPPPAEPLADEAPGTEAGDAPSDASDSDGGNR